MNLFKVKFRSLDYDKFVGINQLPDQARGIIRKFGLIRAMGTLFSLSGTFFVLYIIDNVGFKQAGTVMAVMAATMMLFDYPSGSLGDYIGQRWVLGIAYILTAFNFYLFSIANSMYDFIIVAALFGISDAQFSGALQSWLDNNYKKIKEDTDNERKNYGYTMTRLRGIDQFLFAISIIIGGFLATTRSREFVFQLQIFLMFIMLIVVLFTLKDIEESEITITKQEENENNYLDFLKGGLKFVLSSKVITLFILGYAIITTAWILWGSLILFPIYFGYSGSDSMAGILRSVIFFITVVLQLYTAKLTKKFEKHHLPIFLILQIVLLFGGITVLLHFLPLADNFSLIGFIFLILIMILSVATTMHFIDALFGRIMLDLVPSENRNAIYSLLPTLSNLFAIPLLPITGAFIEGSGLIYGVILTMSISIFGFILIFASIYLVGPGKEISVNLESKPQAIITN